MSEATEMFGAQPSIAQAFKILNKLVTERDGEWCGIPVPLPGLGLVLESRYPDPGKIAELQRIMNDSDKAPVEPETADEMLADIDVPEVGAEGAGGWRIVNSWPGRDKAGFVGEVFILRHADGRMMHGVIPETPKRNRMMFGPFDTMDAWDIETELVAVERLSTLLTERMFKAYVLTGAFLETSKRSGITYMFRRLRPTIAMSPRGLRPFRDDGTEDWATGEMSALCCLCLHPLAYYSRTFCGAMVPTDDVIAHLMLVRGDEKMFWKRATQHRAGSPESGMAL